ncbi:hypothetical protein BX616_008371, partial [Lobosporangium transversale]
DDLEAGVQGMLDYILQEKLEQRIDIVLDKLMELSELEQLNGTVSMNAALFIRDMLIYIELSSAIKAGDTGRIHEMLVWVTIFCQVGGTKNYAYELLRLQRGLKCAWTDQTVKADMSSWLVNTTGQENRWIPTDLYQEHNNLLIKKMHQARARAANWDVLDGSLSVNIHSLGQVGEQMGNAFDVSYAGTKHAVKPPSGDINEILATLKEFDNLSLYDKENPSKSHPQTANASPVENLSTRGLIKLKETKHLQTFTASVRRPHEAANGNIAIGDAMEADEGDTDEKDDEDDDMEYGDMEK